MIETDSSPWLYLFSSSTKDLYAADILNTLSFPKGWILHYRYATNLLDINLRQLLDSNSSRTHFRSDDLGIKQVVISYVNEVVDQRDETGYKPVGLYPIRQGKFISGFTEGEVAHFWFSVENLYQYTLPEDAGIKQHQKALERALSDKTPYQDIYASLGEEYEISPIQNDLEISAFQTLVAILSRNGFRADTTVFAKFHGIKLLSSSVPIEAQPPMKVCKGVLPNQSGYWLSNNKIYGIDISIFHTNSLNKEYLKWAGFEVTLDPNQIISLGNTRLPITGPYDRIVFPFTTVKQRQSQWNSIKIQTTAGVDISEVDKEGKEILTLFYGADWTIPIYIEVSIIRRFGLRILHGIAEIMITVGTALTASLAILQTTSQLWVVGAIALAAVGAALRILLPSRE